MPTKRQVLDLLQRDELLEVVDHFEMNVRDRRVKSQLVDAIAVTRRPSLGEILALLPRDRLKDLCKSFDLDDGGREKAVLVERILSAGSKQQPADAEQDKEPKPATRTAAKKNGGDLGRTCSGERQHAVLGPIL